MRTLARASAAVKTIKSITAGLHQYFTPDALLKSVEDGTIAPLRGTWLIEHQRRGGRLTFRQALPPEAFFPAQELRELVPALGQNWGLLFVALSYRWLSTADPDPQGDHLRIVAAAAQLYLKGHDHALDTGRNGHTRGNVFGPTIHFSPLIEACVQAGVSREHWDFALMWDQCSLYQLPRTPEQQTSFEAGLAMLSVWYGNHDAVTWMQTYLPNWFLEKIRKHNEDHPEQPIAQSYDASGWCFFEATVSACMKPSERRLDIGAAFGTAGALEQLPAYGSSADWPDARRLDRVCQAQRVPPLTPEQMADKLRSKVFSRPFGDNSLVADLYKGFFDTAAHAHRADHADKHGGQPLALDFAHLGWCDEAAQLQCVLPRFQTLTTLDLAHNRLGYCADPDGMQRLSSAISECAALSELNLASNGLGSVGAIALARALKSQAAKCRLASLTLSHAGSHPTIGADGARELGLFLGSSNGRSLKHLDVSSNDLCGVNYLGSGSYDNRGLVAIATALRSPGCSLAHLSLANNRLGALPGSTRRSAGEAVLACLDKGGRSLPLVDLDMEYTSLAEEEQLALRRTAARCGIRVFVV